MLLFNAVLPLFHTRIYVHRKRTCIEVSWLCRAVEYIILLLYYCNIYALAAVYGYYTRHCAAARP